ncbi:unnamed protein product [Darwinula stevensoni]|uniref:Uncharacterized protein n=1 Tax=Darwinula stevensoni TaxID=69355 RepID=A0A7R9A8J9_9CRUS|nr:unnamed protein product [Darwinula stevensoni]CAG0896454.1 unnamed protein product [Darwinula stevensoni]
MVGENKKEKDGKRLKVKGGKREYPAMKAAKLHPNHRAGNHEINFSLLELSASAARSFSTEEKNLLKEKLTAEGEDKGCQLPIVVASSPSSNSFNVGYLHAYKYEVIAGRHIVQARKEIGQETGNGKDTCTCAIYWGLTEEGKRMLALQNAKLQGIPYDALDVLEKYEELRETMENEFEIHAAYGEILKGTRIESQKEEISLCRIAGMEEEEVLHRFSQQVTSESLKSFMGMRKPEEADEWTSFVKLCISRQAIQREKDYPETGEEVKTILGNPLEIPKGTFIYPLHAAVFSINDPGDVEKCLLGLHAHQGRCKAEKKIRTAFCAGDIMHAAEVRESLRRHDLKTDVAILQGEHREGELFKHHHSYVVIGARHRIDLPSSVLTRKEFLQSFHKPNCWLLSNIRGLRKEELPLHLKLVTLVDLKLESEEGGDDSQRSVERLPGFESETQIEAMNVGEETLENFDLEMSPDIPEDSR